MRSGAGLLRRLLLLYASIFLIAVYLMSMSSKFLSRYSSELVSFHNVSLAVLYVVWVGIFYGFTRWRLRGVATADSGGDETSGWIRMTRFPGELFRLTLAFAFAAGTVYYSIESRVRGLSFFRPETPIEWLYLAKGYLFPMTTGLLIAMVLYAFARLLLRPYVQSMRNVDANRLRFQSFSGTFIITFVSLLLIFQVRFIWYVANSGVSGEPVDMSLLLSVSGLALAVGVALFGVLSYEVRKEVQRMIGGIQAAVRRDTAAGAIEMPIVSNDEAGQLAVVFNELRDYQRKKYEDAARELELARGVLNSLSAAVPHRLGNVELRIGFQPSERMNGEFYDVTEMNPDETAVVIGQVSAQGASAALIIAAYMALFRREARLGGTGEQIARRLEAAGAHAFHDDFDVSLGLILISRQANRVSVSGIGRVHAALVLPNGETVQWPIGRAQADIGNLPGAERTLREGETLRLVVGTGDVAAEARCLS